MRRILLVAKVVASCLLNTWGLLLSTKDTKLDVQHSHEFANEVARLHEEAKQKGFFCSCFTLDDLHLSGPALRSAKQKFSNYSCLPLPRVPSLTCTKVVPPSFVYIGIGHSGSSSLAKILDSHDDLSQGTCKEHNVFWMYNGLSVEKFKEVYNEQFRVDCSVKKTIDFTPRILFAGLHTDVEMSSSPLGESQGIGVNAVRAIQTLLPPDVKFIVMFRNNIEWFRSNGHVPTMNPSDIFYHRGCYADALESWLKVFPRERFLFIKSEDFFRDEVGIANEVFDFMGISRQKIQESLLGVRRNPFAKFQKHPAVTLATATEYFNHPRNVDCRARLMNLTGLNLDDWAPRAMEEVMR